MLTIQTLDFGFLTTPINEQEFAHFPVQRDAFVVVLPDHPLAELGSIELAALAGIIGTDSSWNRYNLR